jgi:hypothetical protein
MKPQTKHKQWVLVEKENHNRVHGIFGQSLASAVKHLNITIPEYVARGLFTNKKLKAEDFEIVYK